MVTSVVVGGARTPVGRFLGSLGEIPAADLGAVAIRGALGRTGVDPVSVDAVIMGCVVQAGAGPNPARMAAASAGIPLSVPATTINKLCLSGLTAIAQADQMIQLGHADVVVAGGMESMSGAPHLQTGSRRGTKFGNSALIDSLERDALHCFFDDELVGAATDRYLWPTGITRAEHDAYVVRSHSHAARAREVLAQEIVPVRTRKAEVTADEGIRVDISEADLSRLRPVFTDSGIITAASSSPLSDGAAAVVVMRRDLADRQQLPWLVEIGAYGSVAGPDDASLIAQPARAIEAAIERQGITVRDLDLIEINEAFAGVVLHSVHELRVDLDLVNVHGGAIAIGHPLGMSGARLLLTLSMELHRRGGGRGIAALCGGGGQGDALIVMAPKRND